MYQYPYGNAQQLNLDWILSKIQELEAGATSVNIEEVANALVSASFDAGVSYRRYDYCFYNGKLYRALNDTTGAFNPADWLEVVLGDDIPVLTRLLNAVDASLTSLQTTVNDLDSDDIDNASNVTGTSVSDALETVDTAITNLQNTVGNLDSDDIDNASLVVSGATVTAALDTLDATIDDVQGQISAYVETGNTSSRAYAVGDYLVWKGDLYRVKQAITSSGVAFTPNTNIVATNLSSELVMVRYDGEIDSTFESMGGSAFYLQCYTYFHSLGIVWLNFNCPVVTPNTFITIGHFPDECHPIGSYSVTWTGQKGGTYLITFNSTGEVTLFCTDTTPVAQFVRVYIPITVTIN